MFIGARIQITDPGMVFDEAEDLANYFGYPKAINHWSKLYTGQIGTVIEMDEYKRLGLICLVEVDEGYHIMISPNGIRIMQQTPYFAQSLPPHHKDCEDYYAIVNLKDRLIRSGDYKLECTYKGIPLIIHRNSRATDIVEIWKLKQTIEASTKGEKSNG